MRICSLLPGATEIAYLLGLGDQIVGVTHECDYPPEAQYKAVVVRSVIDSKHMSSEEIDRKVAELLQAGGALYRLDEQLFNQAAPDLIFTQGLCDVCALEHSVVVNAAQRLPRMPVIVSLNPHSLEDVFDNIVQIGRAAGRETASEMLAQGLRERVDRVALAEPKHRPRVVCLEWFDPLYVAGHWVPEMVNLAGGFDVLGRGGEPSFRIDWQKVVEAKPDVILLMPCGFDMRRSAKEAAPLRRLEGWDELPAVKAGNVYALNGNAYFSRPGPRLVNGLEILARIIQPEQITASVSMPDATRLN